MNHFDVWLSPDGLFQHLRELPRLHEVGPGVRPYLVGQQLAESFQGESHLQAIVKEAQQIVDNALEARA